MARLWQKIDGRCQACHWWQESDERMITAMTEILIIALLILAVAVVLTTIRDIHDDGYGRRPPPPSRHPDLFHPTSHRPH
jgi:hypothetical protein